MADYQIIDEPKPSPLSRLTVNPLWPLLGAMLGGPVFSWLWSALNALAINGPNRNKELLTIVLAFCAFIAVYHFGVSLIIQGVFGQVNIKYFGFFGTCMQLLFCYIVFILQSEEFEVYQYYGGVVATGALGLLFAFIVGKDLQWAALDLVWGTG